MELLRADGLGKRVAQVVDVGMVLGRIVAAFFAFGDDVVLEGDSVFVALHDHQLAPAPGQVHAERKLVAPARDAMNDVVLAKELGHLIDGGEDGLVEKCRVIAVVILLPLHRLAFGVKLLGNHIPKRPHPPQPPFGKRLIQHGAEG